MKLSRLDIFVGLIWVKPVFAVKYFTWFVKSFFKTFLRAAKWECCFEKGEFCVFFLKKTPVNFFPKLKLVVMASGLYGLMNVIFINFFFTLQPFWISFFPSDSWG